MAEQQNSELLRLNNQLCFALYAATRVMTKSYREKLGALGLTYPQYLVLIVLWEKDGLTLTEIGRRLLLDSGTLTPLIKRLEQAEMVRRARRISDEREVEVWLTPKGARLEHSAASVREYIVCRLRMTEDEIGRLRSDLMNLIATLEVDATIGDDETSEPLDACAAPHRG